MTRIPSMISISRRMSVQPRPIKRVGTSRHPLLPPSTRHFLTVVRTTRSLYYASYLLYLYLLDLACRLLARPASFSRLPRVTKLDLWLYFPPLRTTSISRLLAESAASYHDNIMDVPGWPTLRVVERGVIEKP